jgi:PAS domain S-box-containing protein
MYQRILVIDDNASIHEDFRTILCARHVEVDLDDMETLLFGKTTHPAAQCGFEIDSAYQGKEGLAKVQEAVRTGRPYSLVFVDGRMPPGWDGVETLQRIWKVDQNLESVLCSAYSDYSWEQLSKALGRSDRLLILMKPFDSAVVRQLATSLTEKRVAAREMQCRLEALTAAVAKYSQIVDAAADGILVEDGKGRVADCNAAACRLYCCDKGQLIGLSLGELFAPGFVLPEPAVEDAFPFVTTAGMRADGTVFEVEVSSNRIELEGTQVSVVFVRTLDSRR